MQVLIILGMSVATGAFVVGITLALRLVAAFCFGETFK